jgi:predicted NBD/HSP70 family sugar kinase
MRDHHHLPLDPAMRPCACGRRGGGETMVGLAALLRAAADPRGHGPRPVHDLEDRLADLRGRAESGDGRTLAALARIAEGLGLDTSILVDVLNPQAVVLGGYFAFFGDYLADTVRATLGERVLTPGGHCEVLLATLGFTSAARGAAHQALEIVLQDPGTVATMSGV